MSQLRDLGKMRTANDGTRTLFESVMAPELIQALKDWSTADAETVEKSVLIGGLALSFYARPRMTQDVDVLFLSDADIPDAVDGFKRTRAHGFEHRVTHVEIEVVTPTLVKVPVNVVQAIFASARTTNGIRVASPSGLVALKLFRMSRQDIADIAALIELGDVDLSSFNLPQDKIAKYAALLMEIEAEKTADK